MPINNPQRQPLDELYRLFPAEQTPPSPQTFEIGLVLGGTVSEGVYTTGALDFLIEAIDRYYETCTDNPPHKLLMTHAGGTSGGAVSAALLAIATNRTFTHVTDEHFTNPEVLTNPFYKLWVEDFDFAQLTDTAEINDHMPALQDYAKAPDAAVQHIRGLFNGHMLDTGKIFCVNYAVSANQADWPTDFVDRSWIAKPFRVAITAANLRGVPYQIHQETHYPGYAGPTFVEGDDYAWFAVPNWVPNKHPADFVKRPDEFIIDPKSTATPDLPSDVMAASVGYDVLAGWACASGAISIGLPARILARPAAHYLYRPKLRVTAMIGGSFDQTQGTLQTETIIDWPTPYWQGIVDPVGNQQDLSVNPYIFSAVDGGTYNNDPVTIVHAAMTGIAGHNPTTPEAANRALVLIDPLSGPADPIGPSGESLVWNAGATISAYTAEARYLTADRDLFADEEIYSRFQVVPVREIKKINDATLPGSFKAGSVDGTAKVVGSAALAGQDFFATSGWCSLDYRRHDYLLGRYNMRQFLENEFVLSAANDLFNRWYADGAALAFAKYAQDIKGQLFEGATAANRADYYLPIVPVIAPNPGVSTWALPKIPDWPVDKIDIPRIADQFEKRIVAVAIKLLQDNLGGFIGLLGQLLVFLVPPIKNKIRSVVKTGLTQPLYQRQLISGALAGQLKKGGYL